MNNPDNHAHYSEGDDDDFEPHAIIRHTIRSTNRNSRAERTASEINFDKLQFEPPLRKETEARDEMGLSSEPNFILHWNPFVDGANTGRSTSKRAIPPPLPPKPRINSYPEESLPDEEKSSTVKRCPDPDTRAPQVLRRQSSPSCVPIAETSSVGNGNGISKLISENTEGSAQAPQLPRKKDKRDFPVSTAGAQTLFITHILFTGKNQGTRVEHGGVPASPEAEEDSLELRSLQSWRQHEDSASFIWIERWLSS